MDFSVLISLVQIIVALLIVIALAYISLRVSNKFINKNSNMIKIIERVGVSNNSSLCIVNVCDSYYLMSLCNGENRILKELNKEDVTHMIKEIEKEKKESVSLSNLFGMRK